MNNPSESVLLFRFDKANCIQFIQYTMEFSPIIFNRRFVISYTMIRDDCVKVDCIVSNSVLFYKDIHICKS